MTTFANPDVTGKQLWLYDPKTIEAAGDRLRVMWDSNRGISYWKGKIYVATADGRLNAIDAKTGKEVWSVMTVDPKLPYFINGAPRVFKDKVIIGNGGTEWGPLRGYVTAYDTETGKQLWRFYTVPGNPADGFENKQMELLDFGTIAALKPLVELANTSFGDPSCQLRVADTRARRRRHRRPPRHRRREYREQPWRGRGSSGLFITAAIVAPAQTWKKNKKRNGHGRSPRTRSNGI